MSKTKTGAAISLMWEYSKIESTMDLGLIKHRSMDRYFLIIRNKRNDTDTRIPIIFKKKRGKWYALPDLVTMGQYKYIKHPSDKKNDNDIYEGHR